MFELLILAFLISYKVLPKNEAAITVEFIYKRKSTTMRSNKLSIK